MTLLTDSVRLLRARVLFWVTLALSAVVALVYLSLAPTPDGMSLFFGLKHFKMPGEGLAGFSELAYVGIFTELIVGGWLAWAAVIVALISCAPIFPDFMSEGSIGIPMSKPVSRPLLFFYKYIGSLLFVILQVSVFCVIVFFAMRWRLNDWNFSIFWAIPVVTLMFSYIYSVVVLVSIMTRSMLAALLAGSVVWLVSFAGQWSENHYYENSDPVLSSVGAFGMSIHASDPKELAEAKGNYETMRLVMMPLPKTSNTVKLLDRLILIRGKSRIENNGSNWGEYGQATLKAATRHSIFYIVGSSLAFEAVMLGLAAWIFCRRDY